MVALLELCPSFDCKLPYKCEDITKNAWRTPLNAQSSIDYRLQYSLFLTFLNYHRNRLFLYFLVSYRISIISLLFWVSIPNSAHFSTPPPHFPTPPHTCCLQQGFARVLQKSNLECKIKEIFKSEPERAN